MSKLEDLRPNASVQGILPNCLVTVVNTQWFGSEALELTYKDPGGKVANELLYRHDEPRIEVAEAANFGVSDRRFRFKPAGGFGGNRQAVSVQSGTPLRMGFGPDFGEPPLRDTSYLALVCQSKYSCHYL